MFDFNLSTFRKDETGAAGIELMFMAPAIVMLFAGTMTFFDAYRAKYEAQAATNTVADMISRETMALTDDYLDGMVGVFDALAYRSDDEELRVSVIKYDAENDTHSVSWSQSRGASMPALSTADIDGMQDRFPLMGDMDSVVYLETKTDYIVPVQLIAESVLDDFEIKNSIVITPRFATTVCFGATASVDPDC